MDIARYVRAVINQNKEALPAWFHPDATVRWHSTNEQFTVTEFVRANCEYPGTWEGAIERVEEAGDTLIVVVRVYPPDRGYSFHGVSFLTLKDGRIAALDEYWSDDAPAPVWRQRMGIGRAIR